jgi:hypothetical protein
MFINNNVSKQHQKKEFIKKSVSSSHCYMLTVGNDIFP